MSFATALPLLSTNALATDDWRNLVAAWRQTPFVPNYAYRLSHLYRFAGRKDVAQEVVDIAFRMDHDRPDSVWLRAQERIRRGDFGGWRDYQTRWSDPAFRQGHDYQRWFGDRVMWDGVENLRGKSLLVVQEQGMGDCIQMLRYLSAAKRACAKLYAFVHPSLYLLVQCCYGDILEPWDLARVRDARHATVPGELLPMTDRHIGFMSLPGIFGPLSPNDIIMPWSIGGPFQDLSKESGNVSGFHETGLAWRGNPKNLNDHNRSMSREGFDELVYALRGNGNGLWSFQIGEGAHWAESWYLAGEFQHFIAPRDWLDTAKRLRRIDRLVTIDSAVMHLAGSLGIETYCLLCYAHDFRFPEIGDMPEWYPSVTFLRQERPGDWDSCIPPLLARLNAGGTEISVQGSRRSP